MNEFLPAYSGTAYRGPDGLFATEDCCCDCLACRWLGGVGCQANWMSKLNRGTVTVRGVVDFGPVSLSVALGLKI
jgi:hypothetical protein